MAIIKCKMCGGDMDILEDSSVCECEYCGTKQTVPSADNEKKLTLFGRAGRLLRGGVCVEFHKDQLVPEAVYIQNLAAVELEVGIVGPGVDDCRLFQAVVHLSTGLDIRQQQLIGIHRLQGIGAHLQIVFSKAADEAFQLIAF